MRVLLVESHADTRELYAEFLEFAGFAVITADTTDAAADRAGQADVIVTGIHVRGTADGLALIRTIRCDPATAKVPVIVLTASAYPEDVERAHEAGCDMFLSKPCLPADLAIAIHDAAGPRRSRMMVKSKSRRSPLRRSA